MAKGRPLFESRPGVSKLQVYLPLATARELAVVAGIAGNTLSKMAAVIIAEALADYESGVKAIGAPDGFERQKKLA